MSQPPSVNESFQRWWHDEGSVGPAPGQELETFMEGLTRTAWLNGAYSAERLAEPEFKEVQWALVVVLDGIPDHDLADMTGLSPRDLARLITVREKAKKATFPITGR
jgi:hypothetical protein